LHFLVNKSTGGWYFIKHLVYFISLVVFILKSKKFCKVIGISGPCVDFTLYLLSVVINVEVTQFIQGNIADSHIAAFGLKKAKQVFYLPTTYDSIVQASKKYPCTESILMDKCIPFVNGIDCSKIKVKVYNDEIQFLWAASLLKWKRLDLFTEAISKLNNSPEYLHKYSANVCYIEPQSGCCSEVSEFVKIKNIHWYSAPNNLNAIRAHSTIFVSTSESEPFGLSILESMFAGLAIVIPKDNSYWDQQLIDGYDCVKYEPNKVASLVHVFTRLIKSPTLLSQISRNVKVTAQNYTHHRCYSNILKCIPN